jgi:diguanylate cyclase (GGDEF)-like protein
MCPRYRGSALIPEIFVMPSTETLLVVVIVATAVNLVLGLVLLVAPRFRRRGGERAEGDGAPVRPSARGAAGSGSATMAGVPGNEGRAPLATPGLVAGGVPSDPQTGLDAPVTWQRWLREEDARVRRYQRPATVVLVELEGLDRLVERLGADAAGRLIPPVAATMRRHGRESDHVARLGPSRFGAILPETDEVQAINYVERVRSACDLWLAAGAVTLRLSMGWAETNPTRAMEDAVRSAEERLNAERRRGQVVDVAPEPGPAPVTRPSPAA